MNFLFERDKPCKHEAIHHRNKGFPPRNSWTPRPDHEAGVTIRGDFLDALHEAVKQ